MKLRKIIVILISILLVISVYYFRNNIRNEYFTICNLIRKNNLQNINQMETVRGWYFLIDGDKKYILQIKGQPTEMIFVTDLDYNFFEAETIDNLFVANNQLKYNSESYEIDYSRNNVTWDSNHQYDTFCISDENDIKYNGCIIIENRIIGDDIIESIVYIK